MTSYSKSAERIAALSPEEFRVTQKNGTERPGTGALLHNLVPEQAAGRLSGLLIGAELGAARDFWHNRKTIIIGAPELAALYETPMRAAGADVARMDGGQLVLAGLSAAHLALQETP